MLGIALSWLSTVAPWFGNVMRAPWSSSLSSTGLRCVEIFQREGHVSIIDPEAKRSVYTELLVGVPPQTNMDSHVGSSLSLVRVAERGSRVRAVVRVLTPLDDRGSYATTWVSLPSGLSTPELTELQSWRASIEATGLDETDIVAIEEGGFPFLSWYHVWGQRWSHPPIRYGFVDTSGWRHLLGGWVPSGLPLIPLWPGAVLNWVFWSVAAWYALRLAENRRQRQEARRVARGLCAKCHYEVRGLTTCPECGTPSGVAGAASGAATGTQAATAALSVPSGPPSAAS